MAENGGLNKPAKQPKNSPAVPKSRSSLVWPEGRNRPLPTEHRDLARLLAKDPMAFEDMIDWVGKRIDLDSPDTPPGPGDYILNPDDVEWDPSENICAAAPDVTAAFENMPSWTVPSLGTAVSSGRTQSGNAQAARFHYWPQVRIKALNVNSNVDNFQIFFERETSPGTWTSVGVVAVFTKNDAYAAGQDFDSGWVQIDSQSNISTFPNDCGNVRIGVLAANGNGGFAIVVQDVSLGMRWAYLPNDESSDLPPSLPTFGSPGSGLQWDGSEYSLTTTPDFNARLGVRVNSGGSEYKRRRLNVIPGSSKISVSHADDSGNEEVDLTLDVVPGNIPVTSLSFPGGSDFLRADGSFVAVVDRMNAAFSGEPLAGGTYPVVIPRGSGDSDITIDLERFALRLEVPASSGDTVAVLQKATGGGAPTWTDVATCTITAGNYEATEQTIGAYTITSGDLLRLYFTSVGTGADYYTGTVTGTEV